MTLTGGSNATDKEKGSIARFTKDEKDVLFNLFKAYEEVIDIKHRKNSRRKPGKMEIRQCWQEIHDAYNSDMRIATRRNLRQLQKFWLNARLRKRYPSDISGDPSKESNTSVRKEIKPIVSHHLIQSNLQISPNTSLHNQITRCQSAPANSIKYEIHISDGLKTNSNTLDKDSTTVNESHQISMDTSSNDNISLNDLIEFRSSNENHPDPLIIKPVSRINESMTNNQNNSSRSQPGDDFDEEYFVNPEDEVVFGHEEEEDEEVSSQKVSIGGRGIKVDQNEVDAEEPELNEPIVINRLKTQNPLKTYHCSCEDRLKSLQIKQAELKVKEQRIRLERERIELSKSQEELRYMKEMHRLQLEEMQAKIRAMKARSENTVDVRES